MYNVKLYEVLESSVLHRVIESMLRDLGFSGASRWIL